jgi:hypothetical protein
MSESSGNRGGGKKTSDVAADPSSAIAANGSTSAWSSAAPRDHTVWATAVAPEETSTFGGWGTFDSGGTTTGSAFGFVAPASTTATSSSHNVAPAAFTAASNVADLTDTKLATPATGKGSIAAVPVVPAAGKPPVSSGGVPRRRGGTATSSSASAPSSSASAAPMQQQQQQQAYGKGSGSITAPSAPIVGEDDL